MTNPHVSDDHVLLDGVTGILTDDAAASKNGKQEEQQTLSGNARR